MDRTQQQQQLFALIGAMNEALDKQRWRRLPALHQQLMRLFHAYEASETSATELRAVKEQLHAAFAALIERRTRRAELLKARMDKHQQHREGVLAYSVVNLISEKA
ncbi:flagellar protein FliT [Citrobacter amalonaticus]|uniref:Flagellar protein FliT n=1 Tax=Citrobacter amalonaticus TaxID=35703 RepID=A0A2S4RRK3_CITAM|nr:flagellar protein FliT [Citrobacter amalonaticus]POT58643.1 flagellar protein FliT [Citrobacter amalonaticus]POT70381.1 flagellar protein FliT [Citrobacter amalonaticus]POU61365.1 flagellar protein FliT [Citrobacter amalonaticus]POV05067.1 flagellar protein FliT [Citrobacter amalonaticus]